ncbi:CDP-alcohol phosphatidyltransferase family protein [Alphaproteobacteria bacterium LSUCC0684]
MLDARIRQIIDPVTDRMGKICSRLGISANRMTVAGFVIGAGAFVALSLGHYMLGLGLILLNRLADGLDGAIARHEGITDLGGYLDIVFDFIFYALVPLGFAVAEPDRAVAAAFLIVSFVGTGTSFLAFAIMAEKRGINTAEPARKSLYYLGGLTEGAETIAVMVLFCVLPEYFIPLAFGFGALCWITTATRIASAVEAFGDAD